MTLQELVKEVHRYGEDVAIVELNNGYAIGYEKRKRDGRAITTAEVIPVDDSLINRHSGTVVDGGEFLENSFSAVALDAFKEYRSENKSTVQHLEEELLHLYQQALQKLDIKEVPYRPPLGEGALALGLTVAFPLLAPLTLAYLLLAKPQGSGSLGFLFFGTGGPFLLAKYCKEMITPSVTAYSIKNQAAFVRKEQANVAVDFTGGKPSQFFGAEIILTDGDSMNPTLLKPDRNILGNAKPSHTYKGYGQRYEQAQHYLALEFGLHQQLQEKMDAHECELKKWQAFKENLNREDHSAFLKNIGFMEV